MLTPVACRMCPIKSIIDLFRLSPPAPTCFLFPSKVHVLGERLSQHSREAEERMRSMDDATRNMLLASTATKSVDAGGTDISFPAGKEVISITHKTLALHKG